LRTGVVVGEEEPQVEPVVTGIDPSQGKEGSVVSAEVYGGNFKVGAQVKLRESGVPVPYVIEGEGEVWVSGNKITCTLNLGGAPLGYYDVVVVNPDLKEGVLEKGFEVTPVNVIYVDDSNTSGIEDGSQSYPYNTIQEGLAAASSGWEVWVDDSGLDYMGPISLKSDVVLKSVNWDEDDGDDEASIFYGEAGAAVIGAEGATIEGFVIDAHRYGIDCNGVSCEIKDCRVVNLRYSNSIGIWIRNGSYTHLDGVEVSDVNNNTDPGYATFYGIVVDNCPSVGGEYVLIEHTVVKKVFSSGLFGGSYCWPHGIYVNNSSGVKIRNTIVNEVSGGNYHDAYGIRIMNSQDVELVNNVIYNVYKSYYYGTAYGLYIANCVSVDVRNTIISRIRKGEGGTGGYYQYAYGVYQSNSTYEFEYNDVYDCQTGLYAGLTPGVGCISANPLYVNPGEDFHLSAGSPCINTGDPSIQDYDGSQSDMGAYGGPGGNW